MVGGWGARGVVLALLLAAGPSCASGPGVPGLGVDAKVSDGLQPLPGDGGPASGTLDAVEASVGSQGDTEGLPVPAPPPEAHVAYAAAAGVVERNFRTVRLPEDPMRPQGDEVLGLDLNPTPFEALPGAEEDPQQPLGESTEEPPIEGGATDRTAKETVPESSPLLSEPMNTPAAREPPTAPPAQAPLLLAIGFGPVPQSSIQAEFLVLAAAFLALGLLAQQAAAALRLRGGLLRTLHGLAPLLVRIKSHQALEDPKRRLLYSLIRENPGISTKELCEAAHMSRSAVEYHLAVVARAKLVVSDSVNRGRYHFPAAEGLDRTQRAARIQHRNALSPEASQA